MPEVPQNVIVHHLANRADFKFKGDLLLWSQPITLQVVKPGLPTAINFFLPRVQNLRLNKI